MESDLKEESLTGSQWARNTADEDGLSRVERLSAVHDEIGVGEEPRTDLHRLVLHTGTGDTHVQLRIVDHAFIDQILYRAFVGEDEERVALGRKVGFALLLVRPIDNQRAEALKVSDDFL